VVTKFLAIENTLVVMVNRIKLGYQLSVISQYASVKGRDAINRRQDERLMIVETQIYRVFVIYNFHQKTLTEPY
jgi:hypothetical protein